MSDDLIRRAESHLECCPIGKCKTCDLIRDLIAALKRERKRIAELQQARDQAQAEADRCAREYAHEAQARQRAAAEVERLRALIREYDEALAAHRAMQRKWPGILGATKPEARAAAAELGAAERALRAIIAAPSKETNP